MRRLGKNALPRLFVWAACLFLGASLAMLVGAQSYSAFEADRDARLRIERIVANGLENYFHDMAFKAVPQVYWDDAVRNLDHRFDGKWADEYVGDYLWEVDQVEHTLIFDRDDRLRYVGERGRVLRPEDRAAFAAQVQPLVAAVRRQESRRPIPDLPIPEDQRLDPILARAVLPLEGGVAIVSATLVQPDFKVRPLTDRVPVVVIAKQIDAPILRNMAQRFLLDRARLDMGVHREPGRAAVPLRDFAGSTVATLHWVPPRPGALLWAKTLPPLLAACLTMAVLAWLTILKGRTMARDLVASEAAAKRLAYVDLLTGLPNRAGLAAGYQDLRARRRRRGDGLALLCIDLDHFKSVNDSFGHPAGDELIRVMAAKLTALGKAGDVLARLGGDEFVMVHRHATEDSAAALADSVIRAIVDPVHLEAGRVFIGASIGILLLRDEEDMPVEEALRRADLALYRAKDLGRNRAVFFDPSMDAEARGRQQLVTDLSDALSAEALTLDYQPQVDRSGAVVGLEALIRWRHPTLGEVPPARFVALAEETGLIDALGRFALRQAFRDSARWPTLRVAINLSAAQLRKADFVADLAALVAAEGVDPRHFELEITEGTLLGDDPHTHSALTALRDMGFRIALDDFGTGFSSLGYLQRYPIDKVKIDRSFVARIGVEKQAESIVQAIVRLAHSLGLEVVAEGVETEAQWLSLLVAGCPEVQGYLTGRPQPAEQIEERLGLRPSEAAKIA